MSVLRLIYFIPWTATWTLFSTTIPETSHLNFTFEKQPQDIDNFKTGVEAAYNKRGNLELMQLKKSLTKHFISDYIARMDDKRNSLNSK